MRRPGRIILRALLAALLLVAIFAAFWLGLIPQRLSPLAPISLGEAPSWFVDFRLAALRRDPELCRAVLREPHIKATPIPDSGIKDGCGWVNAVRLNGVGGAEIASNSSPARRRPRSLCGSSTRCSRSRYQPLGLA
jgi:hypothetical protein